MLTDENMILTIFKMKFSTETTGNKNATLYFNHTISVVLFSYAIAQSASLKDTIKFTKDDYTNLLKTAFFHNIGALTTVDTFMDLGDSDRKKKYYEANRNSGFSLSSLQLPFEIMDAIRFIGEHPFERYEFVNDTEKKASWFANIIVAADFYSQLEVGLFGSHLKPSKIIDKLNLMGREEQLNMEVVKAFSLGLNLKDIFDFYMGMERLQSLCKVQGGRHAWPYPMSGFKSPTLFICEREITTCEHFEKSLKAVTLLKPMRKLKDGKYARCLLTSPQLQDFYAEHYEDIKSDMKDSGQEDGDEK